MARKLRKEMRTTFKLGSLAMVVMMIFNFGSLAFAMDCKTVGSRCVEEGERVVDGFKVTRCWKYEDSFECKYPSKDNCRILREDGCLHVSHDEQGNEVDECIFEHQGKCMNYKKNYACYKQVEVEHTEERTRLKAKPQKKKTKCTGIRCLDGSCGGDDKGEEDSSLENQEDMLKAITQMTAAKEMAKDQVRGDMSIVSIFRGDAMQCKKNPIFNFRECCGSRPEGWGVSIGFSRCKPDAMAMLKRRQAGHCVDLGSYCSKKVPVVKTCLTKKHRYCCFGGKLQRMIHEQGRRQLGIGFGDAKNPNCRGFTIEELSRLDFGKIDFREYYDEVIKHYKTPDVNSINNRISSTFANIAKDFAHDSSKDSDLKNKTNQIPFRNKKFNEKVIDENGNIVNRPHM